MLKDSYDSQTCSIARALEVVGERWTLLVVRDLFLGLRRFDEIQENLGIARNVLAARLEKLVTLGIVRKVAYSERPPRHEYRLTAAGRDLYPAIEALRQWGDAHAPAAGGPPTVVTHRGCGGAVDSHRHCADCGVRLELVDLVAQAGPGASAGHPLRPENRARRAARVAAGRPTQARAEVAR